jgi:eukaryotic-like serine/threonine-protein kinase
MSTSDEKLKHLGQYGIGDRLGAGGMAEVFLAKKLGAEGTVKQLVVKRVLPVYAQSGRFRRMFIDEAQVATRLNHPNVVQVFALEEAEDASLLLAMEYVEGPDLGKVMSAARAKSFRLPPWVSAYIIAEAAKGLHYAHERKGDDGRPLAIVHRDVSPQNILVSYDGAVKITDFGIASANLFRDESGLLKGKFGYMSPEQASGLEVDRRSDIYALGVCLYEMLTARSLHGSLDGDDLLEAVRRGEVEPPTTYRREVPAALEAVLMKTLEKKPENRFQTAREFSGAVSRALMIEQQLVDATSIEALVTELVPRRMLARGSLLPSERDDASGAPDSAAAALSDLGSRSDDSAIEEARGTGTRNDEDTKPGTADGRVPSEKRGVHEARHVAIVSLRLFGLDELEQALGRTKMLQQLSGVRKALSEVAFKHSAEWVWKGDDEATAIVGLQTNSSRSSADAAWLAVDTHDSLTSASEDLPSALRGGIGIVRGVADGERSKDGQLHRSVIQPPADTLSAVLGARTEPSATWVAGGLYRVVRRDFRWRDAPSIQIAQQPGKNLPRVMRVYALERPLSKEERIADLAQGRSELVGREAEKADLHTAYHRAAARGASVIVSRAVMGEAGIGKSALVSAFLKELPEEARVLRAEASEARMDLPYGLAADVLRAALGLENETEPTVEIARAALERVLGPMGVGPQARATLGPLSELAANIPFAAADEGELSYRARLLGSGIRRVIAALAMERPLVLVAENLQGADKASLELIADLLSRRDQLPVLALLVSRAEDRVLPYLEGIVRVDVRGLSHDDQIRLVEARLGVHEGVAAACADLLVGVAGNPYFLLEFVDWHLENGGIELVPGQDGAMALARNNKRDNGREGPATVAQVVGDRVNGLPPEERAIVDWLAVAKGALSTADLSALIGWDSNEHITRVCARGVCELTGDLVTVRHQMTRELAYKQLPAERRTAMHRHLGEHLASGPHAHGLAAAVVAQHLARGEAKERAGLYYLEAAQAARNGYELKLAIKYFERAFQCLPPDSPQLFDAHEAMEATQRIMGSRASRRSHLGVLRRIAQATNDPRQIAIALARSARLDLDEGNFQHGIVLADNASRAARAVGTRALILEAEAVVSELHRELGDLQNALAACDRALAVAGSGGSVPLRARAEILRTRGTILRRMGRLDEAVEAHAEAIAIFRRTNAKRQEARAMNALAYCMIVSDRWEDAVSLADHSLRIDLEMGGRFQVAKTLANLGVASAKLGAYPRAATYFRRACDIHQRYADYDSEADTLLVFAEFTLERGDLNEAARLCSEASAIVSVTSSAYDSSHERVVRALIARRRGDLEAAAAHAYQARAQAERHGLVSFHLYASAIEGAVRVERGEPHVGTLLAHTAFSSAENIPTEYGLEIRALAVHALENAGSQHAADVRERTVRYCLGIAARIHNPADREQFRNRPDARSFLVGTSPGTLPGMDAPAVPSSRGGRPNERPLGAADQGTGAGTDVGTNGAT